MEISRRCQRAARPGRDRGLRPGSPVGGVLWKVSSCSGGQGGVANLCFHTSVPIQRGERGIRASGRPADLLAVVCGSDEQLVAAGL